MPLIFVLLVVSFTIESIGFELVFNLQDCNETINRIGSKILDKIYFKVLMLGAV